MRRITKLGFRPLRTAKGSHLVYAHPDGRTIIVARHTKQEVGPGLAAKILKAAEAPKTKE
jgi:predicted RNA binding protein YcfA (HicA-like mRNA interferase family)